MSAASDEDVEKDKMNTHPTNEHLNHERLTDLAQFAVPDGHNLWPRIEQAARASASGMTTPRPGILSLGLSRAWTAVGVLLIAATFAALGFGLAVLVLSNGHDQVPAAPVTPTPAAATATPIPPSQQAGDNTPPLYVPDFPRDLDHIRDTLGSVFVPTYVPDGYQLSGASVNTDTLLPFETSLVYRNGRRGTSGQAVGEFFMYQFPEGWDADMHETNFDEQTIDGLTVRRPWSVRDTAAFYFQADDRWHYISVFGESPENAGINELVRVARSVQGFSEDETVDWLGVSGITRRGFGNNVLSDLDDFIEGRTDSIYISGYLPDNLGLESMWISQDSDSLTLEFVLPSHLRDGKRLERVTLTTRSNPTLYSEQVDVGSSTGYVFWGTTSSDVTLVFQYEGRWFELEGSPARDKSALDELIMMALSLELYGEPDQRAPAPTNVGIPNTIPSRELAHAKMQTILSGETLDKYRALPPAYQEALGLYTWHDLPPDLVRSAVKDKIDQWGDDWIIPLPEFIGEERAERFDELEGEIVNHAHLLLSYYALVLNTEPPDLSRSVALREYMDYVAPLDTEMPSTSEPDQDNSRAASAPKVTWQSLETVLTNTALARLDMLGPRIRERVMDAISSSGEDDIKNVATFLTLYELFLLKAQPGLEMPSLEETLTGDDLATFKNFSEADRDSTESFFQRGLFSLHYVGAAGHPPNSTIPDPTPDFLADQVAFAMEWMNLSAKSETEQNTGANTPRLAFHSNRDGNWNVYVMNADGSDQTRLTDNPAVDSWPSWSPDGRRITFISSRDDPDPNDDDRIVEIYVMNADGSDQTRLTNDSAWHSLPRWSPDGRQIAYQSYTDENWEIHVMNADGSDQRRLTDNSAWDGMPSWSPDSQRIAFHSTVDENAEIYVINADGSDQANLTNDAANDWSPSWSPDGRRIAFHSHRDGNSEIYIMNADGSDQTRLTNNPARDIRPVWSSDGRSIAFTSNRDDPDPDDDDDIRNIYVMNPDGSGLTRLTNESSINYASSWSSN